MKKSEVIKKICIIVTIIILTMVAIFTNEKKETIQIDTNNPLKIELIKLNLEQRSKNYYKIDNLSDIKDSKVSISWNSYSEENIKLPKEVILEVKNNKEIVKIVKLNSKNNWSTSVENITKDLSPTENYTLEISSENKDLDNFYGSYVITKNNSMNIVMMNDNSLDDTTPQTYVEVNKVWDDNDNEAGKRPKEIKFGIYDVLNQYELETFVLSEENNWNYSTSFFPCLYAGETTSGFEVVELTQNEYYHTSSEEKFNTEGGVLEGGEAVFTVTNTFTPVIQKIQFKITKNWDDNNNLLKKRPSSIQIGLYGSYKENDADNSKLIETLTLDENSALTNNPNSWQIITPIIETEYEYYYIKELDQLDNYKISIEPIKEVDSLSIIDVDNEINKEDISLGYIYMEYLTINKTWNDNSNSNNTRPESIILTLYNSPNEDLSNKKVMATIRVDEKGTVLIDNPTCFDGGGSGTIYSNSVGVDLSYSGYLPGGYYWIEENEIPNYHVESEIVEDSTMISINVTNTYVEKPVNTYEVTLTNTYDTTKAKIDVTVNKVWNDNNDEAGKRPNSVEIALIRDNKLYEKKTITADMNWEYTFTDIPKYSDSGNESIYEVIELDKIPNYTATIDKFTITNTYVPSENSVNFTITKNWDDNSNFAKSRPHEVKINIYGTMNENVTTGGTLLKTVTLTDENALETDDNVWQISTGEFTTTYDYYYFEEESNSKYYKSSNPIITKTVVSKNNNQQNSNQNISAQKQWICHYPLGGYFNIDWNHTGNENGDHPESVDIILYNTHETEEPVYAGKIRIYKDKYIIIDDEYEVFTDGKMIGDWKYKFYDNASIGEYTYFIVNPEEFKDYDIDIIEWDLIPVGDDCEFSTDITYTYAPKTTNYDVKITNTYEAPRKIDFKVKKVWDDKNNKYGLRPSSIEVEIYGVETEGATTDGTLLQTLTLSSEDETSEDSNIWQKSITELETDFEYFYIKEINGSESYTTTIKPVEQVEPEIKSGPVPSLSQNNITINNAKNNDDINIGAGWGFNYDITARIHNVDEEGNYLEGAKLAVIDEPGERVVEWWNNWDEVLFQKWISTNTYQDVRIGLIYAESAINSHKDTDFWYVYAYESPEGYIPIDPVCIKTSEIELFKDYEDWGYIDIFDFQSRIDSGEFPPDGEYIFDVYVVNKKIRDTYEATITNSLKLSEIKTQININKIWSDNNSFADQRPNSIKVDILNGDTLVETITIDETMNWTYTSNDLPLYDSEGNEIEYTIREHDIKYYKQNIIDLTPNTGTFGPTMPKTFEIVNTYEAPRRINFNVKKVWDDKNNKYGLRPSSIEVEIYGVETEGATTDGTLLETLTLTSEDETSEDSNIWQKSITELETDFEYFYIKEINGSESYTTTIKPVEQVESEISTQSIKQTTKENRLSFQENQGIILGVIGGGYTYSVNVRVHKVDEEGNYLKGAKLSLNEAYDGYISEYGTFGEWTTTDNFHDTIALFVWSVCNDEDDDWPLGEHPEFGDAAVIELEAPPGYQLAEPIYIDHRDIFGDLTEYELKEKIESGEFPKSGEYIYEVYMINKPIRDTYEATITNSLKLSEIKTQINVNKIWTDNENKYNKRPDSIKVDILSNNEVIDTITINESMNWVYTSNNLPAYDTSGNEIEYSIKEHEIEDYIPTILDLTPNTGTLSPIIPKTFEIINTYDKTKATKDITVNKVWNDNNDEAGERPESVEVALIRDYILYEKITLTSDMDWKYTFKNVPVYNEYKEESIYEVIETEKISNYTTTIDEFTITNTYEPETNNVNFTITKNWDDNSDTAQKRPDKVNIKIYGTMKEDETSGGTLLKTVTLTNENVLETNSNIWQKSTGEFTTTYDYFYLVEETTSKFYKSSSPIVTKSVVQKNINQSTSSSDIESQGTWHCQMPTGGDIIVDWNHTGNENVKHKESIELTLYEYTNSLERERVGKLRIYEEKAIILEDKYEYFIASGMVDKWHFSFYSNDIDARYTEIYVEQEQIKDYDTNSKDWTLIPVGDDCEFHTNISYTYAPQIINYEVQITNTFEVPSDTKNVEINKVWTDNEDKAGKRPDSILVDILNGDTVVETATLTSSNNWTYTSSNLPVYDTDGNEIDYTIREQQIEFYTSNVIDLTPNTGTLGPTMPMTFEIINTFEVPDDKVIIDIEKIWDDNNNLANKRPNSVTLQLLADGQKIQDIVLNKESDWKKQIEELPKYNEKANEIIYSLDEEIVPEFYKKSEINTGYDPYIGNGNETIELKFTNKFIVPDTKIEIPVEKIWDDNNNYAGKRPTSVTIQLFQNGIVYKEQELTTADDWKYIFTNLPEYDEKADKYKYTISEKELPEFYTSTINGYTITNKFVVPSTTLKATAVKRWEDNDDAAGKRPKSIKIEILADGQVYQVIEMDDTNFFNNNWLYELILPIYNDKGDKIYYTMREVNISKYYESKLNEISISDEINSNLNLSLTNTFKVPNDTTNIVINKVWTDNEDKAGKRPDSILVDILNRDTVVETATLTSSNNWTYTSSNLPVYDSNGDEINYTIREQEIEFYTSNVIDLTPNTGTFGPTLSKTYEIINTFNIPNDKVDVTATKEWNDSNDKAGKRPELITIQLKNGDAVVEEQTISSEDNWSYTFNVPKYDENADVIIYTIDEKVIPEFYEKTIVGNTITNTFVSSSETISYTVVKEWNDSNDKAGKRPESITIQLKNGDAVVKEQTISSEDNWSYTFNVPKYDENANEIEYTVDEKSTPEFYTKTISGNTIINTFYVPNENIDVTATKIWNDNNDKAGKRPNSIVLQAKKDGVVIEEQEVNSNSDWKYTFLLPKYDENANEIEYTVDEKETPMFYQKSVSGTTITNTFYVANEKVDVTATKVWNDNDDKAGKRPESVTIQLKNGNTVIEEQKVNSNNNWMYTFNVPKYDEFANEIIYTVDEKETTKFYVKSIEGYVITNTFVVPSDTKNVEINKVWTDSDNKAGKRPSSINVEILNGNSVVEIATISESNNWSYISSNLPVYDSNGDEIEYTIREQQIEFYTSNVIDLTPNTGTFGPTLSKTYEIINTFYVPEDKVDIEATKVWNDNNDKAGKRPESITIQLKNGNTIIKEQIISSKDNWLYTFNVPKYDENADEIIYTIDEKETPNFYQKSINGKTITNTFYVPDDTIEITVNKEWIDDNNKAGHRPESITLQIIKGDIVVKERSISEADNWKYTFIVEKYDEFANEIIYIVDEKELNKFYKKSISGTTITNTFYVPEETIEITATKEWNDNNDRAGKRPNSVILQIKNNNSIVEESEVNESNNWTYTFTQLPKYDDLGKEITYIVDEKETPKFYQKSVSGTTVTNTFYVPEDKKNITVTKIWNDNDNKSNKRPNSVILQIKDGTSLVGEKEITAYDDWKHTFNVPKYNEFADEIIYTVDEKETPKFYQKSINGNTITNTFEVPYDTIEITATKIWEDNDNESGKRLESITFQLKNGKDIVKEQSVGEQDNWIYTFKELPKYDEDANEIEYTLDEKETSEFYIKTISGYTITNKFIVPGQQKEIKGEKIWIDYDNKYNTRPESVTIQIYDKETMVTEYEVSDKTNWKFNIKLDLYDEYGNEIEYTLKEEVLEGYDSTIKDYTITNKLQTRKIKTEVIGGEGGTITGDENIPYGSDSTENNIIIKSEPGYILEEIRINGEKIDINNKTDEQILEIIKNVREDQLIQVVFTKKPAEDITIDDNPNTRDTKPFIILAILSVGNLILFNHIKRKRFTQ